MTMTREQAIRNYVEHLTGDDLVELVQHMNTYDGSFDEFIYYDMDEFDGLMSSYKPMNIALMIFYGDFNPNDDYFQFDAYGNLVSFDWMDIVDTIESIIDDIIDHLVNYYSGNTPWTELDCIVDSDDDALFSEDYAEVYEEEEEG